MYLITDKKIAREQAHQQAATRLHNLAVDCKDTVGKWLFYITTDNIDPVWEKIARAIVEPEGVLRGKAISAKTSPYQLQVLDEASHTTSDVQCISDILPSQFIGEAHSRHMRVHW